MISYELLIVDVFFLLSCWHGVENDFFHKDTTYLMFSISFCLSLLGRIYIVLMGLSTITCEWTHCLQ